MVASLGELYVDWRMDDATILTPPNLPKGGDMKGGVGGNETTNSTTTTTSIPHQEVGNLLDLDELGVNDPKGSHRQESGSSNKLDWLLKWTNAATTTTPTSSTATSSSSTTAGVGIEATAATAVAATSTITFEEEGPLDRLVGTTRVSCCVNY